MTNRPAEYDNLISLGYFHNITAELGYKQQHLKVARDDRIDSGQGAPLPPVSEHEGSAYLASLNKAQILLPTGSRKYARYILPAGPSR